ncbi:MAG: glycosyltransferase family 39 protein [Phycisphaerae bacterium]|nr:glycosyltransferase family 39 protein [Phycisphaerae bacterium]
MAVKLEARCGEYKSDAINLAILVFVTSLLGVYLIATAVLISKDGVFYIERAQKLSSEPINIIKAHPPGYPFLIFAAHKFVSLFSKNTSLYSWIYSAHGVNLLCRVLALVPLYFIGKLLVGSRNSFWALLILILLPYPAEYGSDALRDWPYILFLATGFLFLLWGAEQGKWVMFGLVGLAGGLGHIVRPECAQLVLYGILWLLIGLFLPRRNMNRPKLVYALFILLFGFAVPTAPYLKVRGRILPRKLYQLINSSDREQTEENQDSKVDCRDNVYTAESIPINVVKAIGELFEGISNNLMHFFILPLLLGIHLRFRKQAVATDAERFFIPVFIVFNIIMMVVLYSNWKYISRRHCLPLVVFTVFYVPIGLQILADWLTVRFSKDRFDNNQRLRVWFFVLVITGLAICTPKLLRPIHADKKAYKAAAQWLKENTQKNDLIAVFDKRISFYAERKGLVFDKNIPMGAQYAVAVMKNEDENPDADTAVQKELSLWIDQNKKTKKIVIYRVL